VDAVLQSHHTAVTRTSACSVAPIHFPSRPRFLPIPRGLCMHTHAIPILVDCTLSLPILVVFLLIIPFHFFVLYLLTGSPAHFPYALPLYRYHPYYIQSPIPYCRSMTSSPFTLTAPPVGDSAPVILTIVLVHDLVSPLPLPYHRYLTQFSFCLPFSVLPLTAWSVLSSLTYINPL